MKMLRNSILCIWASGIGIAQAGSDSGWTFQNPQLTGNTLHAVAYLNANRGSRGRERANKMIAVGEQGTIVRTTDGGNTWTHVPSGTGAWLSGVSFASTPPVGRVSTVVVVVAAAVPTVASAAGEAGAGVTPATRAATFRAIAPSCRSRFRTPASRV